MSAPHLRPATARVQSVERAAALLRAVAAATGSDGTATALAEAVGLNRTTSWRLLTTLEQQQLVTPRRGHRHLLPGPGLLDLADQASGAALVPLGPGRAARPRLPGAGDRRPGGGPRRRAHLRGRGAAGAVVAAGWLGREVPLHATSTGKVLLAFSHPVEVRALLGLPRDGRLPRHTPTTITSARALEEELALTRGPAGTPCAAGEFESSAWGVSAPVLDLVGRPVAVVSLWGPSERLTEDRFESLGTARRRRRGGDRPETHRGAS